MVNTIAAGTSLFSGDPSVLTPATVKVQCPQEGRGWAYVHVKIAAKGSDTCTVGISGRLNPNGGFVALTKSDNSTAFSVAQVAGAATEVISQVQLMPEMKVVLSGTRTSAASLNVWLEAKTQAPARTDS